MSAASEPQVPVPKLDRRELVSLLQQQVAEEPCPHSFIHKVDAYSAKPADLVAGLDHAPGTDQGDGKGKKFVFVSPARFHDSAHGGPTQTRHRAVPGGCVWRTEGRKKEVLDEGGRVVGYTRTLYYGRKTPNSSRPGTTAFKRLGWCMQEVSLEDGADKRVLCVVYQSTRTDPEPSSAAAEDGASDGGAILGDDVMPCPAPAPALSIVPAAPAHQALCRPGGGIVSTRRVAIVKRVDAASVPAGAKPVVMKFGRSTVPSAKMMEEMAGLVLSYPADVGRIVAVVLSELHDTTNNILLAARKALACIDQNVSKIYELAIIKELYFRTIEELGLDRSIVSGLLDELESHLRGIANTKGLTPGTRNYLLLFGELASTNIFFEYLNTFGKGTVQEWELRDVTTMGRSSSYLTAISIGRDLGSTEIQAWKDVDGMFTCDPKIYEKARLLPYLTFDEGAELMYFCEQSRQQTMESAMPVVVKNWCNPRALGTVITKTRSMSESILTSIVLKSNITMLEMEMLGNSAFQSILGHTTFSAKAFSICNGLEDLGISVDCVVSSGGKMLLALVPSKLLSRESIQLELDDVVGELTKIAAVDIIQHRSVISLIGNAQMSSVCILHMALNSLFGSNVEVHKILQGSSKVKKVSLFVNDSEAQGCVKALHDAFFDEISAPQVEGAENEIPMPEIPIQMNSVPESQIPDIPNQENRIPGIPIPENPIPENSSVAASSGFKRKAEALPGVSRDWTGADSSVLEPSNALLPLDYNFGYRKDDDTTFDFDAMPAGLVDGMDFGPMHTGEYDDRFRHYGMSTDDVYSSGFFASTTEVC